MKVKECIKLVLIGALVIFISLHLTFAYIEADPNPFNWKMIDRLCFAIFFWGLLAPWVVSVYLESK